MPLYVSYLLLSPRFLRYFRGNLRYPNVVLKRFDNSRPEFLPFGFACELWTPTLMPRPSRHNEIEVNLLRSGSLTVWLEVQPRLLRLARVVSKCRTARYPEPTLSPADRQACYIAQNYYEPLTSTQIAAASDSTPTTP
jgi:hypothetical protein